MDNLWIAQMIKEGNALPADQRKSAFTKKLKKDQKVLGLVDPSLHGLVFMSERKRETAKKMAEELMALHRVDTPHDEKACEQKMFEITQLKDESDLLLDVFWNEVRHATLNLTGVECITVTADWEVVDEPVKERPSGIVMVSLGSFDFSRR